MPSVLETVIGAAESALGVKYVFGGNDLASGIDCSGLVQKAFQAAGYSLPRVSNQQAKAGRAVQSPEPYKPGDLLYWDNSSRNNGADHIAIYIGNGMMIESPKPGGQVRVVPVAGRNPNGARRIIGEVEQHKGVMARVKLGPNADRKYATAAVKTTGAAPGPTETPDPAVATAEAGGGLGDDLPPNATDEQIVAYINQHYADVAPFLANDEIRNLAFTAAREDLSPTELGRRFRGTQYYRTHGPDSRAFDEMLANDREGAELLIDTSKRVLSDQFAQLGVQADDGQLGEVAKRAIRLGWINRAGQVVDQGALNDFAALSLGIQSGTGELAPGTASVSAESLARTARAYGVSLTQTALKDWTLKILQGQATADTYKQYVTRLAKSQWKHDPDVQASIDDGLTVEDHFASHKATIARTLELSEEQVDLVNDPRWSSVTQMFDPTLNGGKGGKRSATLGEAAQAARNDPRYADTREYKEKDANFALRLAQFFGRAA